MATPVVAAEPTPFKWASHANVPARISDVLVTVPLIDATIHAATSDDKKRAFLRLGCRNAGSMLTTALVKHLVHRTRPNGENDQSFFSGHTSMAMVNSDTPAMYGVTLGVAWGRQAAGKHYATDVAIGALDGWLWQQVCK